MSYLLRFVDLFLHLDKHLSAVIQTYGATTYFLLFLIIFCETGLVFTPFLPGDSLIFAAAALAASGAFKISWLVSLLWLASVIGDNTNYWIGRTFGAKILEKGKIRFVKQEYLERTHLFYEKHGGKAVVLGKFFPIIRTFVPFVAGLGKMNYGRFLASNLIGGTLWIGLFSFVGFNFGNLPVVKHNFSLVIMGILFVSVLPAVFEFVRQRRAVLSALPPS
ncbi:MAG TPA: DedA family protein [Cyanobacteria bacterium UBA8530]|nr:DedA family protein [Cyanobacteria bacterium UBA8530]